MALAYSPAMRRVLQNDSASALLPLVWPTKNARHSRMIPNVDTVFGQIMLKLSNLASHFGGRTVQKIC
jgi:hypothetical protein